MQHQVEYSDSIYGMKRWVFGATVGMEVGSCLGHRGLGKQTVPLNRNTTSTSKATVRKRAKESGASVRNRAAPMCATVRNRARTAITTGLGVGKGAGGGQGLRRCVVICVPLFKRILEIAV